METWPLYQCLKANQLALLIQLQWKLYGTRLDLLNDPYKEVENLEEIEKIIKVPSKYPIGFYFHG